MIFALAVVALVGFILFVCWLGRGQRQQPGPPSGGLFGVGAGRDYGRLTEREWEAHESALREMDR